MTNEVLKKDEVQFYQDAANYWSEIPASIDGMLGGFGHISQTDICTSKILLKQLFNSKEPVGRHYVLDCGAGIGRITKYLFSELFDKVDMVEQNPTFLKQAKNYLGPTILEQKVGEMFAVGLQNFEPEPKKYDVIWMQWVLGHLTDKDLIEFLKHCQCGLKENGVIVVKENITSSDEVEVDQKDSSVTRPMMLFKSIFGEANLECCKMMKQNNFPKGLYSVYMFVLKPRAVQIDEDLQKIINECDSISNKLDNVKVKANNVNEN